MTNAIETQPQIINPTTRLAIDRTRLAYERTLMAWIRTAISLISFGFTIYKFFQIEGSGAKQDRVISATEFSVLMIVIGLVSLLMATLQHRRDLNSLKAEYPSNVPRSLARVLAALISVLGILALVAVVLRR
ncbi:MAG: YidH family protein [Bryobacteraceae bacterium]